MVFIHITLEELSPEYHWKCTWYSRVSLLHGQSYLWHSREIIIPTCTQGVPVDYKLVVSFRFCFAERESNYELTIDRETPHTSPSQARYGVSIMSGETRLDITGLHYHLKIRIHPGPWSNIKMTSYQYRKFHCGDKTIWRPSYLHNGISDTGKTTSLYWIRALEYS